MVGILSLESRIRGLLHQRNCKKHYIFALFCLPPTTSLFLVKKMESDFTIPEVLENLTRCYYPVVLPFKVSCLVLKTNSTKNGFVWWFFVTICILKSLWYSSQQQSPFSFFLFCQNFRSWETCDIVHNNKAQFRFFLFCQNCRSWETTKFVMCKIKNGFVFGVFEPDKSWKVSVIANNNRAYTPFFVCCVKIKSSWETTNFVTLQI